MSFVVACTHLLFRDVSVSRRLCLFKQTLAPIRFFRKETAGLQLIAVNRGINQAMTNIFTVIGAGRDQAFIDRHHLHAWQIFQIGSRSEEHTSELQSLMRISYAVFCLKKKTHSNHTNESADRIINIMRMS